MTPTTWIALAAANYASAVAPGQNVALVSGFGIGFANPLTLVFFLTLFPALIPQGVMVADLGTVLFYSSAVVVSGLVALLPYILASFTLSKAGFSRALNIASGGAWAAQ